MRDPAIEQALVDDHAATARRETLEEVEALVGVAMINNDPDQTPWFALGYLLDEIKKLDRESA